MNLLFLSKKLNPSLLTKSDLNKLIKQASYQTRQLNLNDPNSANEAGHEPTNRAVRYRRNQDEGSAQYARREPNVNASYNQGENRSNRHRQFDQPGRCENQRNRRDYNEQFTENYRPYAGQSDRYSDRQFNKPNRYDHQRNRRDNDSHFREDYRQYSRQSDRQLNQPNRFDNQRNQQDNAGQFTEIAEYRPFARQTDNQNFDRQEDSAEEHNDDESTAKKEKFDYKKYKSLNHQQNELLNRPKNSFKPAQDKYQEFAKRSKHLKAKHGEEESFGSLVVDGKKPWLESEFLEDDPDHMERMEVVTKKRPRNYYLFEIQKAIYEEKHLGVQRAMELYREMQLDRKLINADFFKMLIKGCALVGYVEKAFELFDEYRAIEPSQINRSIVTSMFNCCANSPDKEFALKKAKELYDNLRLQGYDFNLFNYNCLIRTFGLLNDLEASFAFVDLIVEHKFCLNVDTFNNLLTAVCSNKAQGLSLATNIIQAMRFLYIKPNIQTYNMLYRITRDCQFGSEQELNDQIKHFRFPDAITSEFLRNVLTKQRSLLKDNYKRLEQRKDMPRRDNQVANLSSDPNTPAVQQQQPSSELMCLNFLGSRVGSIENQLKIVEIDHESLSKPENRLKLIGGLDFLLRYMYKDNVNPDIKTVSLLTSIIANTAAEESKLLNFIENSRIKVDTDFYNMLIRRANARGDFEVAKSYLRLMTSKGLKVNVQTYGVMAMACSTGPEISAFLDEMETYGVRPNVVIMNQLIRNCSTKSNFNEIAYLIKCLRKYGIKPTTKLAEQLAFTDELALRYLKQYDEEQLRTVPEAIKLNATYLKFKKSLVDYLSAHRQIEDESDVLGQFKTEELPRNEEYHRFKVQMTHVLREKKRFLDEMQAKFG